MPNQDMPVLSENLMGLMSDAVQEALEMLRFKVGLVPFVLLHTREGRVIRRFSAPTTAEALDHARRAIGQEGASTEGYVLLYDAMLEFEGQDVDAFIIEAGERHQGKGVRFAQRYVASAEGVPALSRGQILYLGQIGFYLA